MPGIDGVGVDKRGFFKRLGDQRNPDKSEDEKIARRQSLKDAWAADGLDLNFSGPEVRPEGTLGSSFDAQRLIVLARKQGREDQMIEAIYTANHVRNECLSDWSVLIAAADYAGVTGAATMLASNDGKAEVRAKIEQYIEMGITAVPVIVIDDKYPIMGAPDKAQLAATFSKLLAPVAPPQRL